MVSFVSLEVAKKTGETAVSRPKYARISTQLYEKWRECARKRANYCLRAIHIFSRMIWGTISLGHL